jgi:hypothetical protein
MLSILLLVLFFSNSVIATTNNQSSIKFTEEILNKLRLPTDRLSTSNSYDEFEFFSDYQCAIECVKDKNRCTSYTFDATTKTCSLFDDATKTLDNDVIKIVRYPNERFIYIIFFVIKREQLKANTCNKIKCKPDAVCIGEEEPICVCLNGEPTPDDCDKIG